MASVTSSKRAVEGGDRHRTLPPDQQEELEKDGRVRRFLCDMLRLRVIAYIVAQPASFLFILSLFLIALCMPPIGWYISSVDNLPDLDSMRVMFI